jgi:hypothetical protein
MVFEVNGYRLTTLDKDPELVRETIEKLAVLLSDARGYLTDIGRADLAATAADLAVRLDRDRENIDDAFDREMAALAAAGCQAAVEAGGDDAMRSANRHSALYERLAWSNVDLVIIRIGGVGTLAHRGRGSFHHDPGTSHGT